ncbi:MOSC domain-containing protein [Bosea sp. (in: a-proteobacteria)]|uniref:MOSC domain-containing protein n=1 Tax=Bosea sp. (in: a-proteobacteria) TaxID=1871050 RepID=UPI0027369A62|nr:MOSC domain-containing protein [Bosea sp. (in: a-proteobacteria)]MDP3408916.1 MOSC domain-containing protein [Bosea sp. (in: a-proteobacteria)]
MPLDPASPLARLLDAPMRPGRVVWIGLRPLRRGPMQIVETATLDPQQGLLGDHYSSRTGGARHVTLIQAEHLAAIAAHLGCDALTPELLRRNIVVSGINLAALKGRHLRLGTAVLEATGECHPCSRMEEILGEGGYNAVRGHGGITARVIEAGEVSIGSVVMRTIER